MKVTWSIKFEMFDSPDGGSQQEYKLLNIQSPGYPNLPGYSEDVILRSGFVYLDSGSSEIGKVFNLHILGNGNSVSKSDEFRACVAKWIRDYKLENILADENES